VKKKFFLSLEDKIEWTKFTKQPSNVYDKDSNFLSKNKNKKVRKLDLHGYGLSEANQLVKQFIKKSFADGIQQLIVITGKGLRSKINKDPYRSKKMNILKNSIPEYIKNNIELKNKVSKMSQASLKDGGEGAIYIFLKTSKE
jgi:DNA-nicking Smr family endonuclease